jgi:hypothetical protein
VKAEEVARREMTEMTWPKDLADLAQALRRETASKRPPFRPAEGMLTGVRPIPSWEDFEEASRLAAADAEASGTLPE